MTRLKAVFAIAFCSGLVVAGLPASAGADAPVLRLSVRSAPTNFKPNSANEGGLPEYVIDVANIGTAPTTEPYSITDTLPAGITEDGTGNQVVTVSGSDFLFGHAVIEPGRVESLLIKVDVGDLAEGSTVTNSVTLTGGGVPDISASTTTTISAANPSFEFLSGTQPSTQNLEVNDPDGFAATQAGSHPDQMTINFAFPAVQIGKEPLAGELNGTEGGVRDFQGILPRGLILNPTATPVRCTEAELETQKCPDPSQIGVINLYTTPLTDSTLQSMLSPLYSMVPPPGVPAEFAFEAAGVEIYVHIDGNVHEGDYSLTGTSNDILARFGTPVLGLQLQFWGNPSAASHDAVRGECVHKSVTCPVTPRTTPLLSMPSSCGDSLQTSFVAADWYDPGVFHTEVFPATDGNQNPVGATGCAALGAGFNPTFVARPTTSLADSPSGLSVNIQVPQTNNLGELATAHLKKAKVVLPEGMALNPSSANGLGACSSAEIGIDPGSGVANGKPVSCPDASRVGSVEVDTPLLDHPALGSVYIATPYDNPFNSLLAIYVTVNDPQSGVLIKLPGHVQADPKTGRLTTTFDQNPQLPFSSFRLNFKGGAHGVLRTPATCGKYSTTSELTPWSAPDSGPPAAPHDDYAISQSPNGPCATSESSLPSSPSFDAGAAAPIAASRTPFVFHLQRGDATQGFSAVTVSPPPGLTAKLAGTEQCSDAALAAAAQRRGREEQQSPSCPSGSQVGSFTAGTGSGPSPYYAGGKAYLAGPYKGAPLSTAFITPAVAGPYDLGTIVTRAALYLDPSTGRVRAVSDPLPTILQGIPLDVRSLDVSLDRPDFIRNGTSCDPLSVDGSLTSTLGQVMPLSKRFQLGECVGLGFKPKLGIRLFGGTGRGAHPALRGVLQMPAGGANVAKASVALPHSEFLDQAHIGTVCTRVQFAEGDGNGSNCPAGSIYGHAIATSPLVDYALEGPAILRSSSHKLPDLVTVLHGPPSQPVAVNVVGRIDSVNGGIRTTFEGVPDLPVSTFVLSMAGGKKGLLQNSTNICAGKHKATVEFDAQNGKTAELRPELKNGKCGKAKKKHKRHRRAATPPRVR